MAGSINLANVALGFDSSKITRGVDLSAGEMRKLNAIFKESIAPVDRYNADLAILEKAHKTGAVSADRMSQAMASLQAKYKQGSQGASALGSDLKSTLVQYAGIAAAFQGVKTSLSLAATAESNRISLEVLTGSAEKAKMLFQGFRDLDRSSPLSRQDFSKASQTLIGYGFAAESTIPALRQLSEISIGNAERFQSLSLAFGQVTANGRLMGQEVLQMVNAGFNPLQEISRTTGRSMVELKKAMEDGAISSSMVADALRSATEEGGRFFEMNEKLKNSAAGQWAKIQSDVQLLATEIGTNLLPAAKAFMDLMNAGSDGKGGGGFLANLAGAFATGAEGILALGSDAITNLDGNSQGTKFESMQQRMDAARMEKELAKELGIHVNTAEENKRIQKNMDERKRAEQQAIEEASRLKLEKEKQAIQEAKEYEAAWDQINRDMQKEEKRKELEAEMKRKEAQIRNEAGMRMRKAKEDGDTVTSFSAPTLRAGSVEAYKFMLGQKDKLAEQGERSIRVQEEIKETMDRQLAELQAQAKFTKAR